jgi:hypothetical protein
MNKLSPSERLEHLRLRLAGAEGTESCLRLLDSLRDLMSAAIEDEQLFVAAAKLSVLTKAKLGRLEGTDVSPLPPSVGSIRRARWKSLADSDDDELEQAIARETDRARRARIRMAIVASGGPHLTTSWYVDRYGNQVRWRLRVNRNSDLEEVERALVTEERNIQLATASAA